VTAATSRFAAAILAGGRARRFGGANKAALAFASGRIADRQMAALRQVAAPIFVVGDRPGPWLEYGVEVVPDAIPGAGALGGIYTAIVASPADRTLVVACDLPGLSAAFLERLGDVDADLVIPRSRRGLEPLCAVYSKACAPDIRRRIDRGTLEAAVLPDGVRVAELGPEVLAAYDEDGLLFVNVNTPHDYARATGLLDVKPEPTTDRITTDNRDSRH